MPQRLRLISHKLCPYVQRAVIVAAEKEIPFGRADIDLADKPDWFLKISPTGKVPVLEVTEAGGAVHILFESAVIAEYLDAIAGTRLLPSDPLAQARQRAWIEFASAMLSDIGKFYAAPTAAAFVEAQSALNSRLALLEQEIAGPWFAGDRFGLVDAAFAPVHRYLDVFGNLVAVKLFADSPKVLAWSKRLSLRPSVQGAVSPDYAERLIDFVSAKNSHLAGLLQTHAVAA